MADRSKNRGESTSGSAVRRSLVAGGGLAAGSQRAYSLGSCAMGQTDGRTDRAIPKCPPPMEGHNSHLPGAFTYSVPHTLQGV